LLRHPLTALLRLSWRSCMEGKSGVSFAERDAAIVSQEDRMRIAHEWNKALPEVQCSRVRLGRIRLATYALAREHLPHARCIRRPGGCRRGGVRDVDSERQR